MFFKTKEMSAKNWIQFVIMSIFGLMTYLANMGLITFIFTGTINFALVPYFGIKPVEFLPMLTVVVSLSTLISMIKEK